MVSRDYIYQLIIRLLEDEQLNEKEYADMKSWMKMHPEDLDHFTELFSLNTNTEMDREITDDFIQQQWQMFSDEIIRPESIIKPNRFLRIKSLSRYAAIFVLGTMLGSAFIWTYQKYFSDSLFSQVIEVPFGGRSNIYLTDGTEVILNAGSQLKYNASFGKAKREVLIEGEAYFKVAKDPDMPFIVKTSDLTVKAYGTEFNVKAYPDDNIIETTLIEGSISVQKSRSLTGKKQKEFFIKPNEQVSYHKAEKKPGDNTNAGKTEKLFISRNIDTNISTAWINDRIYVKSEPLSSLIIKLERKYNVSIHFRDPELESMRFSGVLENETIEQVMKAIRLTSGIDFEIKNRNIWLYKKE